MHKLASGSDSTIKNKTQLNFDTQKRRSSRIADQKQKVASPINIKRKSISPQVQERSNQSKKVVREIQERSVRVRQTV